MKNIAKLLIIAIVAFTSCNEDTTSPRPSPYYYNIDTFHIHGMEYLVYRYAADGGIGIINVTKDSLETELLKHQLRIRDSSYNIMFYKDTIQVNFKRQKN